MNKAPNGSNGAPAWARELSADVRAYMAQAAEDRKRADEDRRRLDRRLDLQEAQLAESVRMAREQESQAAIDRREAKSAAARQHEEFLGALRRIDRVGGRVTRVLHSIERTQQDHTKLLQDIARMNRESIHVLHDISRTLRVGGNGRNGGNGHGAKP